MMKLLLLAGLVLLGFLIRKMSKRQPVSPVDADKEHELMQEHVRFYRDLDKPAQEIFRRRVTQFLQRVRITPVEDLQITDLDRLYVAASAIIPIFSFKDWSYNNLNEVLLYPGNFAADFDRQAAEQHVLGMVGDGAMHRMMILSLPALRAGFEQDRAGNTGIHEFVHLLDKADGATDGVPEYMIPADLIRPWLTYTHQAIRQIKTTGSDINPYAATNDAEFFAVISEYFFQKPHQLQEHHPDLYQMLQTIYHTE